MQNVYAIMRMKNVIKTQVIDQPNWMIKKAISEGEIKSSHQFHSAEVGIDFTRVITSARGQRKPVNGSRQWYMWVIDHKTGMNVFKPSWASTSFKTKDGTTPSYDHPKPKALVFRANAVMMERLWNEFGLKVKGDAMKPAYTNKYNSHCYPNISLNEAYSWNPNE